MDGLRQYVISVVAAALLCGIVSNLFEDSAGKDFIKMLCGLLLMVTAILPVRNLDLSGMLETLVPASGEVASLTTAGEKMADEAMADIIKQKTRTYILDKAKEWNAAIEVEVTLDEDHVPATATIQGDISPYAKAQLAAILETDLGITREHQVWIS